MRYIALHTTVTRCRPETPLVKLHNDCGREQECARRMAANLDGNATRDFSKIATPYGFSMLCSRFVALAAAPHYRDGPPEAKPMQRPDA